MTPEDIKKLVGELQHALTCLTWARLPNPPWVEQSSDVSGDLAIRMYRGTPKATDAAILQWVVHVTAYRHGTLEEPVRGYTGTAIRDNLVMNLPPDVAEVAYKLADTLVRAKEVSN
jgi:hypothetical protein